MSLSLAALEGFVRQQLQEAAFLASAADDLRTAALVTMRPPESWWYRGVAWWQQRRAVRMRARLERRIYWPIDDLLEAFRRDGLYAVDHDGEVYVLLRGARPPVCVSRAALTTLVKFLPTIRQHARAWPGWAHALVAGWAGTRATQTLAHARNVRAAYNGEPLHTLCERYAQLLERHVDELCVLEQTLLREATAERSAKAPCWRAGCGRVESDHPTADCAGYVTPVGRLQGEHDAP